MKLHYIFLLFLLAPLTQAQNGANDEIYTIEHELIPAIVINGEETVTNSLLDRMEEVHVPGVSVAVVRSGQLLWAKGYGIANSETGAKVDEMTLFQAGSISKPIAALAALKLADQGKLDLDTDVNEYLKGWQVPDFEFESQEKVTIRRLLTHTAGMTIHGFPGYTQENEFPDIVAVLDGNGNTGKIFVDTPPDSIWRYSGGGYTVMEKAVEDVSGMPLEKYMANEIFPTIDMKRSTYAQPLTASWHDNASAAYDNEGNLIEGLWHNYPEQAAAGLWTTPSDLAKYCIHIQNIASGKQNGILSKDIVDKMLTKHKNGWGLGPSLNGDEEDLRFGHGGKNAGFTNNMVAFAHKGDAIIVMTNADNGGQIIGDIIRTASRLYQWDLSHPDTISPVDMPMKKLASLVGKYKYVEQVPGIGDYIVEVKMEQGHLTIDNPQENIVYTFTPLGDMNFIDVKTGDRVVFKSYEGHAQLSLLWNNRFLLHRLIE